MTDIPIPNNEKERLIALKKYAIFDSINNAEFDRIAELASLVCAAPISFVSFIDHDRQWFKASRGLSHQQADRALSFCQYTILGTSLLEVHDALSDDRFSKTFYVAGEPNIRYYCGYPLIDADGLALGTVAILDFVPRELTAVQKRSLELLAAEVMALMTETTRRTELRRFEQIFQLSNDFVCIINSKGTFKKFNPAFYHVLGWDHSFLENALLYNLVHPEDRADTYRELWQLSGGGDPVHYAHRIRTKTGEYRWIQWTIAADTQSDDLFAIGRDITFERLKEIELANSEEKLRVFFEHSQSLMCTHDLQGNFITFNSAGAEMLGYTVDEISEMRLFDIVQESRYQDVKTYLSNIRKKGDAKGQMIIRHKNGSTVVWMFNNTLACDTDGQPYVICNAADVNDRYHLINDLQRTREMLEQTNLVARVGGFELNYQTKELYWTSVTKEMHGIDVNANPGNAIDFYQGQSRDIINQAVHMAAIVGKSWDLELQIVNARGEEVWIRSIGHPEFEDGECTRIYGTIQDINEKKTAELEITRSRKLLDDILKAATDVSIIATDLEGIITVFNSGAERMLGYKAADMLGKHSVKILHLPEEIEQLDREYTTNPDERREGFDVFSRQLDHQSFEQREFTYVRKDGTHRKVSLMATPIRDDRGCTTGYLGMAIDITDMVQQRMELKIAKMTAEKANRAKSEFLANMSHEIRTPLNGIIGFTDLVSKSELDEAQRQYLTIANQSADTLLSIVNDILDFAKIEAGRMDLNVERYDIYKMTKDATDIITHMMKQKGLRMLLNMEPGLPRYIWTDVIRLKQVLINLLGNAAKFTEEGEIELHVEMLDTSGDQSLLRFSVCDTGIGISEGYKEKIFEAFSQEDCSVSKRYGGTGLGLTISNRLLGLMGTRLQLNSQPGVGSTFFFDITFRSERGDSQLPDVISKPECRTRIIPSTGRLTVLIAEDNPINMLLTKTVVKRILPEAVIKEARNGLDAVAACREGLPDLILMDLQMPDMDGYEAAREIRSLAGCICVPIIAVTASCLKSDMQRCFDSGMDDVVSKPFVEETIADIIDKWIFNKIDD